MYLVMMKIEADCALPRDFDQFTSRSSYDHELMIVFPFKAISLMLSLMDNTFLRGREVGDIKSGVVPGMQFEAFHFLRSFCGTWPENRAMRTLLNATLLLGFATAQLHLRFLDSSKQPESLPSQSDNFSRFEGFGMIREHHSLSASLPTRKGNHYTLLEHRISLSFHGLLDAKYPPVFSLIVLRDTGGKRFEMFEGYGVEKKPLHVECSGRAAGLCAFQGMVWAALEKWHRGWQDVLDLLDNELSVSVSSSDLISSVACICPSCLYIHMAPLSLWDG